MAINALVLLGIAGESYSLYQACRDGVYPRPRSLLMLISQFWSRSKQQGFSLAMILIMSGLFLIPLVFLRTLPVAMLFMALAGFAAAPYYVVEQSLMQRLVPKNVQGQVFGARGALNVAGYPLGGATGGVLMAAIVAPFVIGISALLCIGMGCACLVSSTIREMEPVPQKAGNPLTYL